ncbi:MAG: hypothetical protein WD042_17415, partial [Phycisphaeraceae bacterium]
MHFAIVKQPNQGRAYSRNSARNIRIQYGNHQGHGARIAALVTASRSSVAPTTNSDGLPVVRSNARILTELLQSQVNAKCALISRTSGYALYSSCGPGYLDLA